MFLSKQNIDEVISLTFGDQGENHVGMDKVGDMVKLGEGFNYNDLVSFQKIIETKYANDDINIELRHLNEYLDEKDIENNDNIEDAYVMIIRNGIKIFLDEKEKETVNDLYNEMIEFEWDKKYFDMRRKKVLNKHARANVCFGKVGMKPDFENKKGTVIAYKDVPLLNKIHKQLPKLFGKKADNMMCEGNRYFDLKKCGIGWHGDAERRKVIAFRLGTTMNLQYNWFYKSKSIGKTCVLTLNHGDMYIMSEKAVGTDWRSSSKFTLRHSAGVKGSKYLEFAKKKK
jgi:hypothetical protein